MPALDMALINMWQSGTKVLWNSLQSPYLQGVIRRRLYSFGAPVALLAAALLNRHPVGPAKITRQPRRILMGYP